MKKTEGDTCSISNLLEKFGIYQVVQYLLLCIPLVVVSMIDINYCFVAGDLEYRCRVDECDSIDSGIQPIWWPDATLDHCKRPVLNQGVLPGSCTNLSFTGELVPCTDWVYESYDTIISELNLACQSVKVNLVGTIHCTGMLVSMVISGWLSDRMGRKPALIFCSVFGAIGILKTFVLSYYWYLFIEFLEGVGTGGAYGAALVLMLEMVGKRYRIASGTIFAFAVYLGESLFVCIAMLVPYWKTLVRIVYGPTILFLSYIFVVNESPRWQVVAGKVENAKQTMKLIAETNKLNIDYEELANIDEIALKFQFDIKEEDAKTKENFTDVFKSRIIIMRFLVASVARFTASFVYYGLLVNSVWLPGDKYINFLLSTVMSFPGELISLYLMNKIGRKIPLMMGFFICGVLCIIAGFVSETYAWVQISACLISKMIIAACFTGCITYSMELFPTSARGSLMGLTAFASRLGGMLAPLTPILNDISPALVFVSFGCSSVLTGSLLTLTPETKDMPLLDTIQQVANSKKPKNDITTSEAPVRG